MDMIPISRTSLLEMLGAELQLVAPWCLCFCNTFIWGREVALEINPEVGLSGLYFSMPYRFVLHTGDYILQLINALSNRTYFSTPFVRFR